MSSRQARSPPYPGIPLRSPVSRLPTSSIERQDMDKQILLYDAKCQMCRNLAVKIQYHARTPVDIVALSDPQAATILTKFYPNGWKHDFYLVQNGSIRKGIRALPKIMTSLGAKQFAALIGEYAGYRAAKSRCGHSNHQHAGNGHTHADSGRRQVLAMAAAAPLLALSKLPRMSDPFERQVPEGVPEIGANLALVFTDGNGGFRTEVKALAHRVRATGGFDKTNSDAKITHREQTVLEESPEASEIRTNSDDLRFVVRRTTVKGERVRDGVTQEGFVNYYGLAVDHGRYNISVNVGIGTVDGKSGLREGTSLSGMIRHDVALPLIDYIVFAEPVDAKTQLAGFADGVRALARHHASAGRERVAALYGEIGNGLASAHELYARNVGEKLVPTASKLVITSMPELLKFVDLKAELASARETGRIPRVNQEADAGGPCDCTCSCGCCCGCGCGCAIGTCGKPGCGCMCMCCCECGCGCSCCLFST
jgi:hypothetical protein